MHDSTYTATTVLPADVWADTKTDWLFSKHKRASFWNGSSMNGNSLAKLSGILDKGTNSASGGSATWKNWYF